MENNYTKRAKQEFNELKKEIETAPDITEEEKDTLLDIVGQVSQPLLELTELTDEVVLATEKKRKRTLRTFLRLLFLGERGVSIPGGGEPFGKIEKLKMSDKGG